MYDVAVSRDSKQSTCLPYGTTYSPSIWPHLFRGAGHEKRRREQLKWSLAFRLYIGSFPREQLLTYGIVVVAKALGGSFKLVTPAPRTVREMTQLLRGGQGHG